MAKPWEHSNDRRPAIKKVLRYLIVTEDEKSGALYIQGFKIPQSFADVVTIGGIGHTDTLVRKALKLREAAIINKEPYIFTWCVFDRNDFPKLNFNRAFELARKYIDVEVIWVNECFELWYLLHYCYRTTPISRHDLPAELSRSNRLGKEYDKADPSIFGLLENKMKTAIKHAGQLEAFYGKNVSPVDDNPSTNIHHLIKDLLKLKDALVE